MSFSDWEIKIKPHNEGYQEVKIVFYSHIYSSGIEPAKREEVGEALVYIYDGSDDRINNYHLPKTLTNAIDSIHINNLSDEDPYDIKSPTISVSPNKISFIEKLTYQKSDMIEAYYIESDLEELYYRTIFEILQGLGVEYVCIKSSSKAKNEKPYKGRKSDIRVQLKNDYEKFKKLGGFVETYGNNDNLNPYLFAKASNLKTRYRDYDTKPPFASLLVDDLKKYLNDNWNFSYIGRYISLIYKESILEFLSYLNRYNLPIFTLSIPNNVFGHTHIRCNEFYINHREEIVIKQAGTPYYQSDSIPIEDIKGCLIFISEKYEQPEYESHLILNFEKNNEEKFSVIIPIRTL